MKLKLLASILVFANICVNAIAADNVVPYPTGYRDWQHVKSMVIQEGHPLYASFGGIHHLYANSKAIAGYRSGKYADGSVIAFDLLEAEAQGSAITVGKRKVLGVMHKDSKNYASTGGWGFEGFARDSQTQRAVGSNAVTACFGCHLAQQDSGFVFSKLR